MKNPKKLTNKQRRFLRAKGFNTYEWMFIKETPEKMYIINKNNKNVVQIKLREKGEMY